MLVQLERLLKTVTTGTVTPHFRCVRNIYLTTVIFEITDPDLGKTDLYTVSLTAPGRCAEERPAVLVPRVRVHSSHLHQAPARQSINQPINLQF